MHAAAVVAALRADAERGAALATRGMAFVFVHGGNATFPGCVGLRFEGAGAEARLRELCDAADCTPMQLGDCEGDYVSHEMLRPLLHALDEQLAAADASYVRQVKPRINLEQLPLTLLLLRTRWPGLPIAVVGYGMVRRSLSIVAVNAARQCVLAVTHEVQWATPAAPAADVAQQFLRCSTTLSDFHRARGFARIQVLAPGHVWLMVGGAVAFNKWFAARFAADGAPLDRAATVAAFERIEAALARGMERSQAVYRYLDMPPPVRSYFQSKNVFHVRAMRVRRRLRATDACAPTARSRTSPPTAAEAAGGGDAGAVRSGGGV